MNRLPDFLICGAQKAGTTSLNFYLRNHPGIYIPWKKELHFFDNDSNFNKGIQWYTKQFSRADKDSITGESTPIYMYLDKVPVRIAGAIPSVRIIFILRNPVERAWSHYWDSVKRGRESLSFKEAIMAEPARLKMGENEKRFYSYIDRGYYIEQIKRYLDYFPRNQMHFILSDKLKTDTSAELKYLIRFLGIAGIMRENKISKIKHESRIPSNSALNNFFRRSYLNNFLITRSIYEKIFMKKNKNIMDREINNYLYEIFRDSNRELSEFLGLKEFLWINSEGGSNV